MIVEWSPKARDDLLGIGEHIANDNPPAALRVAVAIERQVERLTRFPRLGRQGRLAGTRELVIAGLPYLILYRIDEGRIQILRVIHGARQWPERP